MTKKKNSPKHKKNKHNNTMQTKQEIKVVQQQAEPTKKDRIEQPDNKENEKENQPDTSDNKLDQHFLSKKDRFKARYQQEQSKMKDMDTSSKLQYLWDYYKWPAILIIVLVFGTFKLGTTIYKNSRPLGLSAAVLNNMNIEDDVAGNIEKSFRYYYEYDKGTRVLIDTTLIIDPEKAAETMAAANTSTMTSYEQLAAKSFNGYFDVIITDRKGLDYCSQQDLIYPLNFYFPKDVYEDLSEYIVTSIDIDGETSDYALDISNSDVAQKWNLSYDEIYICFSGATYDNYANAIRLINQVLGKDYSTIDETTERRK